MIDLAEMPAELLVALLLGAVFGVAIERVLPELRPGSWRRNAGPSPGRRRQASAVAEARPESGRVPDAADQLRIVMAADFTARPLLNRSETRVFKELDRMVLDRNPAWQVMAQVSLGEVLRCGDAKAYGCVNSKRVDLLLVDENCHPRHAIEYQGAGHHQSAAAARDAVKKEALRRAGVGYHEVIAGHTTPSDLKRLVDKLVDRATAKP